MKLSPLCFIGTILMFLLLSCCSESESIIDGDLDNQTPDGDYELEGDSDIFDSDEDSKNENEQTVTNSAPSDDPDDYTVDTSVEYELKVSDLRWVVPSDGLPEGLGDHPSNANVDIIFFGDRLYMAWRAAPYHFASEKTVMYVVSSEDNGLTWEHENTIDLDTDVREPRLFTINNRLKMMFFQAGVDLFAFEPVRIWETEYISKGNWTDLKILVDEPEVPWDLKTRGNRAYLTSYKGNHYQTGEDSAVEVYFKYSDDGDTWHNVDDDFPVVYLGGVSETAFEFDLDGKLWVVTRNEDGDKTGFGSHVCYAEADSLADWQCPDNSDPERYDSPEMFRHGKDIFLVAREDIGGPYDEGDDSLSFEEQKSKYLYDYSFRPKKSAIYKIDKENRKVVKVTNIPGVGDTAFASVKRTGEHTYLLVNYTSPLDEPDITWFAAQSSPRGTQLYFVTLEFVPVE